MVSNRGHITGYLLFVGYYRVI